MFQYTVQPGDTLNRIATQFDVTLAAILGANPRLSADRIFPGQIIIIPISPPLRRNFPWYFLFPNLFCRHPWCYWQDRRRWPRDWDRDGRGRGRGRRRGRRRDSMDAWNDLDSMDE